MKLTLEQIKTLEILNIFRTTENRYVIRLVFADSIQDRTVKKSCEKSMFLGFSIDSREDSDWAYEGENTENDLVEINYLLSLCEGETIILKRGKNEN